MARKPMIAAGLSAVVAACAVAPAPPPATAPASGPCEASRAQVYLGQPATSQTGDAILKASGAASLRWGPPGGVWTMDYREDRVNVRFDKANTITEIICG